MINPTAEAPVSSKNILSGLTTFVFTVRNNKIPPSKAAIPPAAKVTMGKGMKVIPIPKLKKPTKAQNTDLINLPLISPHLLFGYSTFTF
jgi:hypothetical protein